MKRGSERIPWRHYVDLDEGVVWVHVKSAITAMGACAVVKRKYPGYECHYASEAFLDKKERGEV